MPDSRENAKGTTGTRTRQPDTQPMSGMCPICIRECTTLCEISKAAFRGAEVLYPLPEEFGKSTQASNKDYMLDWSHFQIQVNVLGADGIENNSDVAIFPNVDISTSVGGVPLKVPVMIGGLGSTLVAKAFWDGLAVGAALSGTILTIGENVSGMDPDARFENGKVVYTVDLANRVKRYREFWDGVHGDIVVQTNVEDQRFGQEVYAIKELGVNIIERKWGQGAKAIGGEVRLTTLERALQLKHRGYIVRPDPEDKGVQEAFKMGVFKSFERHSRVGFPSEEGFVEDVQWLRDMGAKKVFLKTGAYNPAVVAFTMKCASRAKVDAVTFDGAGGGTGMSPVPMMNETGSPTVYLEAQVLKCIELLRAKGHYIPDIIMGGGFTNETQMFKAMAMSNLCDGHGPYVKAIEMARSPLTAVMKSDYFVELAEKDRLPATFATLYGKNPRQFFVGEIDLSAKYGADAIGTKIPWPAVGLYTYFSDRIGVGLQQMMAGSRKWKLKYLSRHDLASLSERATQVTGIPMIDQIAAEAMEAILDF